MATFHPDQHNSGVRDKSSSNHQRAMERLAYEGNKLSEKRLEEARASQRAQEQMAKDQLEEQRKIRAAQARHQAHLQAVEEEKLKEIWKENARKQAEAEALREWRDAYVEFSLELNETDLSSNDFANKAAIFYAKSRILDERSKTVALNVDEIRASKSDTLKVRKAIDKMIVDGVLKQHPYYDFIEKIKEFHQKQVTLLKSLALSGEELNKLYDEIMCDQNVFNESMKTAYASKAKRIDEIIQNHCEKVQLLLSQMDEFLSQEFSVCMKTIARMGDAELQSCFESKWDSEITNKVMARFKNINDLLVEKMAASQKYIELQNQPPDSMSAIDIILAYAAFNFNTDECQDARSLGNFNLKSIKEISSNIPYSRDWEAIIAYIDNLNSKWNNLTEISKHTFKSNIIENLQSVALSEIKIIFTDALNKSEANVQNRSYYIRDSGIIALAAILSVGISAFSVISLFSTNEFFSTLPLFAWIALVLSFIGTPFLIKKIHAISSKNTRDNTRVLEKINKIKMSIKSA